MGKYKLLKTIGKGNFAKVKLARHMPTGQDVRVCVCIYLCINSSVLRETEIFMVQKFASVKKRCSRNMYKE